MRAFVFTDPALTSRAGQFVWLELNVDDERNAVHRERLTLEALPTFYVLNPTDESVVMRRVDGMTVAEMGSFLDEARAAATGAAPSSPAEAALLRADRLNGEGKRPEAAAAYREALAQAPAGWPPYGRAVVALLFLQQTLEEEEGCLALAREALTRLSGSPATVMVSRSGLDCALGLGKEHAGRVAAIAEMEAATRRTLADTRLGAVADDVSSSYLSLTQARKDAGDTAGATKDAEAWAVFLEAQAAAAQTPEQRAVFDSHRLSAYLELQQPERAIPMLQASENDLPDDYNPPSRLAVAFLAMKKPGEALAASNRALPKVTGPRRIRVLQTRSEIFAAKGDAVAAREALEQAVAYAESLPAGQRPEGTIKALEKKLEAPPPDEARLRAMTARFAPVDIGADVAGLPGSERRALVKMIEAARVLDGLYLRQVWAGNEALLLELLADRSLLGQARLQAFLVDKGPWSRLDHDAPFLPGVPPRPAGANFYPAGATKAEVEAWMKALPEGERAAAEGFFTTIRRAPDGRLQAVPYSVEYQGELARAAELLREAAATTTQATLRVFLEKRAAAFLSNDYYTSDVAWMELDASLEPTIGPYETYDDGWFGYKAAFEAFITVRDEKETAKLARFSSELQWLEDRLPIDPALRNPKLGGMAPIRVVDVVFSSGQGMSGVQTAAYNLPNDDRVVAEKGSKRVMLKNTQRAKFDEVLVPISKVALAPADQPNVDFEVFFTHILMHELLHGLGPGNIRVGGRETTVRLELKDTYGAIEEAKADIAGLWALQQLVDKGVLDRSFERTMYTTFLASAFRSIRFGISEAHGKGQVLQLNHLLDAGAFRVAPDGTFSVDPAKVKGAVTALTRELMTLQAQGSYAKAEAILERLAVIRPDTQRILDRLQGVPVDVLPRFVTAEELVRR